jgi:hypothetical protein
MDLVQVHPMKCGPAKKEKGMGGTATSCPPLCVLCSNSAFGREKIGGAYRTNSYMIYIPAKKLARENKHGGEASDA